MRKLLIPAALLFTLLASPTWGEEVCDNINAMADGWNDIADGVEAMANEGYTDDEATQAEAAITQAYEATHTFATTLQTEGNEEQAKLGAELLAELDDLDPEAELDELAVAIDDVVNVLDAIVALCDEDHAEETSVAGPVAQGPPPAGGHIQVSYAPPPAPEAAALVDMLRTSQVFEEVASAVSSVLVLPTDLAVVFDACGQPNAFYDPSSRRVVMCYEFFALFTQVFSTPEASDAEVAEAVLGVGAFFLLHELGHALVHLLELPITGREEDSVDNLATLILLSADGEGALFAALDNFDTLASELEQGKEQLPFWDEHSLHSQRLYDVACLIFGSDPERYADMVGPDKLPAERAQRCPQEYAQKDRSWDQLLAPYYAAEP